MQLRVDEIRHSGPVLQLAWAHPQFGSILASCSFDGKIIIWREAPNSNGQFQKLLEHVLHEASVNSVSWAPYELGALLLCASTDGKVSVLEFREDGSWDPVTFTAHAMGCNAASWAPSTVPRSLIQSNGSSGSGTGVMKKFASAGCDNLIKIWSFDQNSSSWKEESVLQGHANWVRDVAWAPNIGLPKSYLASAGQDKTVIIWTQEGDGPWEHALLKEDPFPDVVWRVSWSISGNILAVSCGDNSVTLWKENLKKKWELVSEIDN